MYQDALCSDVLLTLSRVERIVTVFYIVAYIAMVVTICWIIWKVEGPYRARRKQ